MKNALAFFCLMLIGSLAQGQSSYVEVSVFDTVQVNGDQFVFQLMAMPDMTNMEPAAAAPSRYDYIRQETEMRRRQKQILDSVEIRLKSAGFNTLPVGVFEMMSGRGYGQHFLTYRITDVESLKQFRTALLNENYINAVLQTVTSTGEEDHRKRLYTKLLSQAKAKATHLADLSGKKITGILTISDAAQGDWTMYPQPVTSTRTAEDGMNINTRYPLHGKLTVKFAWN